MKEKYHKPVSQVEIFKSVDIITTSVTGDIQPGDNDAPFGE